MKKVMYRSFRISSHLLGQKILRQRWRVACWEATGKVGGGEGMWDTVTAETIPSGRLMDACISPYLGLSRSPFGDIETSFFVNFWRGSFEWVSIYNNQSVFGPTNPCLFIFVGDIISANYSGILLGWIRISRFLKEVEKLFLWLSVILHSNHNRAIVTLCRVWIWYIYVAEGHVRCF